MKIGIDMGHTLTGAGTGAAGVVKETDKNREVGKILIAMLKEKGHTVYDCTVNKSSNDLSDRVKKANAQTLDLFISLHLNAFKMVDGPMGVETFTAAVSGAKTRAQAIQNELVKQVGWKNRGLKTANYYVLRNTKAPAVLVELGFCDSKADMKLWNTEKISKALFKGITGKDYAGSTPSKPSTPESTQPSKPNGVENVKKFQRLCNKVLKAGLEVDGIWGSKTEAAIKKLKLSGYSYKNVDCTRVVQEILKQSVDGIFGRGTERAVKSFQKKHGLSQDGICGFATYKALAIK